MLLLPGDTDGVRTEITALFRQRTSRRHLYISIVIRKEHEFDTLITSAELYTMFSTAAKQASRQPLVDFIEVSHAYMYHDNTYFDTGAYAGSILAMGAGCHRKDNAILHYVNR